MSFKFELYFADTETTGLDYMTNDVIELSIYRLSDNTQRTWCMKPKNYESIQMDALRVNHHKLDDLKHITKFGQETYVEPSKVIPKIENWFLEDGVSSGDRILIGQNPIFDLNFLQKLWTDEGCKDTFPFGSRPFLIDTRQLALFLDLAENTRSEYYNLGTLIKKYAIKNSKAHTAEADTLATKELFMAQLGHVKSLITSK
jgi:DNA polymerase III alpha subunit (gram-positive type)